MIAIFMNLRNVDIPVDNFIAILVSISLQIIQIA